MHFSTASSRPGACAVLALLFNNISGSLAAHPFLVGRDVPFLIPRGTGPNQDTLMPDAPDDGVQTPPQDGFTGIGMEWETAHVQFESADAKKADAQQTYKSKRKLINGYEGTDWKFTADTLGGPGRLDLEITLDGCCIKPGTGDLLKRFDSALTKLVSSIHHHDAEV